MLAAGHHRWLLACLRRLLACLTSAVCAVLGLGGSGALAATAGTGAASVSSLAAGAYAGYALLSSGQVLGWGDDLEGQIGPAGGWNVSVLPVVVPGLAHVQAIAAGANTAYALERSGAVWAWGDDGQDELGDAGLRSRDRPRRVAAPSGVVAIAAGAFSVYVLRRDGTAWAWGDDAFGQLGSVDAAPERGRPRPVQSVRDAVALAAGGNDGYALSADGSVWAWGDGSLGQLGRACKWGGPGVCPATSVPAKVHRLRGVVAIAAGADSCYALLRNGTVWAWGDNSFGELGPASRALTAATPIRVGRLEHVVAIAAAAYTGYALLSSGTVWAWGRGVDGELGDSRAVNDRTPTRVLDLTGITSIAAAGAAAYALDSHGSVWAWGSGAYGQLGDDSLVSLDVPIQVLITR